MIKETYNAQNTFLTPTAPFTFRLDNQLVGANDGFGRLRFDNVTPGFHVITEDVAANWTLVSITPASGLLTVQSGPVCSVVIFKNRQMGSSSSSSSSSVPSQTGCIEIIKETYNTQGNLLTPTAQFTFRLDNQSTRTNDSSGRTRFENVSVGTHSVTEDLPFSWRQVSVTPTNGFVNVQPGICSTVVFKNQQIITTAEALGCIEVIKEAYDEDGDRVHPVPRFTFSLDGRTEKKNDSSGYVRFNDVTPGTHTIDEEDLPSNWRLRDVSPNNGRVTVEPGNRCATVVFENRKRKDDDEEDYFDDEEEEEDVPEGRPSLNVTKLADSTEAFPGNQVSYTITISNNGGADALNVILEDIFPSSQMTLTDVAGGIVRGDRIQWNIGTLNAGQTRVIRYSVALASTLQRGEVVCNSANVRSSTIQQQSQACLSVIQLLPQTGFSDFTSRLNSPTNFLRPIASHATEAPAIVWAALILLGITVGTTAGKKFFI